MTKLILSEVVSILMIGFALGCAGSFVYFMDFLEHAEETNTPIQAKNNLYNLERIEQVEVMTPIVNLSDLNRYNTTIKEERIGK